MSTVVLDAGVAIGFLDSDDAHFADAHAALAKLAAAGDQVLMSAVTLAEVMVDPMRSGEQRVQEVLAALHDYLAVQFVGIDAVAALEIAAARAQHPHLKLPDAAVVAAAKVAGADAILTTDRDFESVDSAVRLEDFVKN